VKVDLVGWSDYRKCPICEAVIGQPCASLSGKIVNGCTDNIRKELDAPHKARKLRTRKAR
jgi:hypothetical protein